jgi:HEAT repeat protein
MAISTAKWSDDRSTASLLASLNDPNEFVAAAAAHALAKLGATNTAPALLAKLKVLLQSPKSLTAEFERQAAAITKDIHSAFNRGYGFHLLDPDRLEMRLGLRVPERAKELAKRRVPPLPFVLPMENYSLLDALIETLGDLGYAPAADELFKLRGTDHDAPAVRALAELAPQRLTDELLAVATDKQVDSFLRERALVTLCHIAATNRVRDLVPLLDDTTPIEYERALPGPEWRICDRAAMSIAVLLGWDSGVISAYVRPDQREDFMKRAREWADAGQPRRPE